MVVAFYYRHILYVWGLYGSNNSAEDIINNEIVGQNVLYINVMLYV
ncbi:hypothetical protein EHF_0337 [Ehrlichia japonica]|uniref:Uncharacterized protein n=1 Tax=Ehrlichia japonica TaxID=391036 RepID=X5H213_9RICK|nr:hypothetical protein EHF_0337 [Ehrlichia japonica]